MFYIYNDITFLCTDWSYFVNTFLLYDTICINSCLHQLHLFFFFIFINYPLVEYCGIIHNILFPYFLFEWVLWSKILPNWTWIRVPKIKLPNVSTIVLHISKVKARVPKKEMHGIIITERLTCRKQFAWAIPFICTITTEHEHIFD